MSLNYLINPIAFFLMSSAFNSLLNSVADRLDPCFSQIGGNNWNQNTGSISDYELQNNQVCCCVGAHVASYYNLIYEDYSVNDNKSVKYHFTDGIKLIKNSLKINSYQLDLIFRCAGTPCNPFGGDRWNHIPIEILNRIRSIETAPPNCLAEKYDQNIQDYYIDVKQWIDKEEANINKALLLA